VFTLPAGPVAARLMTVHPAAAAVVVIIETLRRVLLDQAGKKPILVFP
jgi:hypothetical protein